MLCHCNTTVSILTMYVSSWCRDTQHLPNIQSNSWLKYDINEKIKQFLVLLMFSINKQDNCSTTVPQCPYNYDSKTTSAVWWMVWPQRFYFFLNIRGTRRQCDEACGEMTKDGSDSETTRKLTVATVGHSVIDNLHQLVIKDSGHAEDLDLSQLRRDWIGSRWGI